MTKNIKTKTSTAISTQTVTDLSRLTANDVPALLATVVTKIKQLEGGLPQETKTIEDLPGFGRIENIKTVELLVQAHSMVTNKERVYNESAQILGIETKKFPFKIGGSPASSWVADIFSRINLVKNQVELEKLIKIKTTLEANLSAEAKLARDLQSIANLINEDEDGLREE